MPSYLLSEMYSVALTIRCNDAIIKSKKLRKDDHRIQAYFKYLAVLMVKFPGESVYTSHAKYQTGLPLKVQPIYSTKLLNEIYYLISLISLVYIIFEGPSRK